MGKNDYFTPAGKPRWLIAGLGNPGMTYERTRHNAGFMVLDTLASQEHVRISRLKCHGYVGEAVLDGQPCLLLKPQTYMNNSGESVEALLQFYKLPISRLIVVFDDISLPPGKLRIRRKGSAGGHNGVKSIIELTGSEDFARVKIGVGEKPYPDMDLADWVLSRFRAEEHDVMEKAFLDATACLRLMVAGRTEEAMNRYNA